MGWVDARTKGAAMNYAAIYAAIYGAGNIGTTNRRTLLIAPNKPLTPPGPWTGKWTIDNDLIIPANVNLRFDQGAYFEIAAGKTVTIQGTLEAPLSQIFDIHLAVKFILIRRA